MSRWLDALLAAQQRAEPAISIAVASTRGSVPREAGTRMQVTAAAVSGTIGGGHLEHKAIGIARDMLTGGAAMSLQRFPLGASLGQCCGGLVNLLFEPVAANAAWVGRLADWRSQGRDCVCVTFAKGAACGGKLLVTEDEFRGTLGDAGMDRRVASLARERLAQRAPSTLLDIDGQACFFEFIAAPDFPVMLFGAGHVGRALATILAELPCQLTWVDSREDAFPADVPDHVRMLVCDDPVEAVAAAAPGSTFVVMTHSHALDQTISEQILRRGDFAYFGLIGSMTKRRLFEKRLMVRGIPLERLAAMTCPIGLTGIDSKEPMAIAVGVSAELLQQRQRLRQRHPHIPTLLPAGEGLSLRYT